MNTRLSVLIVSMFSIVGRSHAASDAAVTTALERRPQETLWQTINSDGSTNSYTHLANGLNRWSESDKGYVPANAVIEEVNGTFIARQTAHQVIFSQSSDVTEGTIDLLVPDGRRFRVRPAGLAYTEFKDGQPGRSVFIAELNSAKAELTSANQVTYFNAIDGADVQYDLSLAGLE